MHSPFVGPAARAAADAPRATAAAGRGPRGMRLRAALCACGSALLDRAAAARGSRRCRRRDAPSGLPLSVAAVSAVTSPSDALLQVTGLRVEFGARVALSDVSFELFAGETLRLVGESGSGKSTLARAILRLVRPSRGSIMWRGEELLSCAAPQLRRLRRDLQIVFQDPLGSLDPR